MMQPTPALEEFNPLDVLAAAASLPSAQLGEEKNEHGDKDGNEELDEENADDEDEDCKHKCVDQGSQVSPNQKDGNSDVYKLDLKPSNDKNASCIIKLVESKRKQNDSKPVVTLRDATKLVVPSKQGNKMLTVLKQVSDHSYAFVCQLEKMKSETIENLSEDNGKKGNVLTTDEENHKNSTDSQQRKPAKILIVSKKPDMQKVAVKDSDIIDNHSNTKNGNNGNTGSAVLRTLLGQKPDEVSLPLVEAENVKEILPNRTENIKIRDTYCDDIVKRYSLPFDGKNETHSKTPAETTSSDEKLENDSHPCQSNQEDKCQNTEATVTETCDNPESKDSTGLDNNELSVEKGQENTSISKDDNDSVYMDKDSTAFVIEKYADQEPKISSEVPLSEETSGNKNETKSLKEEQQDSKIGESESQEVNSKETVENIGNGSKLTEQKALKVNNDGNGGKNKIGSRHLYIIEDDLPPTTKFSSKNEVSGKLSESSLESPSKEDNIGSQVLLPGTEVILGQSVSPPGISKPTNGQVVQKGGSILQVVSMANRVTVGTVPQKSQQQKVQYVLAGSATMGSGIIRQPQTIFKTANSSMPVKKGLTIVQTSGTNGKVSNLGNSKSKLPVSVPVLLSEYKKLESIPSPEACSTLSPSLMDNRDADVVLRKDSCSDTDVDSVHGNSVVSPRPILSPELSNDTNPLISCSQVKSLSSCDTTSPISNLKNNHGVSCSLSFPSSRTNSPTIEKTSIGMIGSLSFKNLEKKVADSQQVSRFITQPRRASTPNPPGPRRVVLNGLGSISGTSLESMDSESSRDSFQIDTPSKSMDHITLGEHLTDVSARTCHAYVRHKKGNLDCQTSTAVAALDLATTKAPSVVTGSHLHPLVDHDYCKFTEFSAQVQSSILATTQCKVRTDKKYTKKAKSARTKAVRDQAEIDKERLEDKALKKERGPGRPKKIVDKKVKPVSASVSESLETISCDIASKDKKQIPDDDERSMRKMKKGKLAALRNKKDKNYVKITGSFQNEFVYFATKGSKRRSRTSAESSLDQAQSSQPLKQQAVGGINVFDWYKDLSQADKSSRFGVTEQKGVHNNTEKQAPLQESEVVDLVCELSEMGYGMSKDVGNEVEIKPSGGSGDSLDLMAEQVRNMLNSMGEAELQMLENSLPSDFNPNDESSPSTPTTTQEDDNSSMENLLAPLSQNSAPTLSQVAAGTQLSDLDDINDNDLLPTDLANMNMILGDLTSRTSTATSTSNGKTVHAGNKENGSSLNALLQGNESSFKSYIDMTAAHSHEGTTYNYSRPNNDFVSMGLDKSELFPDVTTPSSPAVSEATAPELTVVSMYWNDLPGLLINGRQHVRLVDIHKQVLPAKDTGILKKRCQMMNLEISNCSELQRDFLVRYANAAKSKSTVIVPKEAAKTLIAFYVEPKPRVSKHTAEDKQWSHEEDSNLSSTSVKTESSKTTEDTYGLTEASASFVIPRTVEDVQMQSLPDVTDRKEKKPKAKSVQRKRKMEESGLNSSAERNKSLSSSSAHARLKLNGDVKRSSRLKDKRVRYDKMHLGDYGGITSDESTPNSSPIKLKLSKPSPLKEPEENSSDHENRDIVQQKQKFLEELEIQKLKKKGKHRKLNSRDKKRLRRLKEKLRRRERRKNLKDLKKDLPIQEKTCKKTKQENTKANQKYSQEHCYAATPARYQAGDPTEPKVIVESVEESGFPIIPKETEVLPVDKPEKEKKDPQPSVLGVVHHNVVNRNGQRGRTQEGSLNLDLYQSKDALCIQCETCKDFYSLKKFLKHLHHQNNPDELAEVVLPQRIALKNVVPTETDTTLWELYEKKKMDFNWTPRKESRDNKSAIIKVDPTKTENNNKLENSKAKNRDEHEVKTENNQNDLQPSPTSSSSTRHSTRVRKRKQLHPIERYVFSKTQSKPTADSQKVNAPCKEAKDLQDSGMQELKQIVVPVNKKGKSCTPIGPVGNGIKRRKVLTRQNKNIDAKLSPLDIETRDSRDTRE